ncbi:hypothetical protein AA988_05050 [Enterococcus cecorum]|nr:hypothetical protein AA988_05050 [Enterococcus cecorum]
MTRKIILGLKLFINLAAASIIVSIPNNLTHSILADGYSGELFVSIFITKSILYVISILLITFSINQFLKFFEK